MNGVIWAFSLLVFNTFSKESFSLYTRRVIGSIPWVVVRVKSTVAGLRIWAQPVVDAQYYIPIRQYYSNAFRFELALVKNKRHYVNKNPVSHIGVPTPHSKAHSRSSSGCACLI